MQSIKAFVGHSFGETDKEVVRKFLDHFRTLESVYPNFMWDHAEEVDLKTLSEKVISKIQDKNVFIGICTSRELAIEEAALSRTIFGKLKVAEADLKRKTSDWIIQEIGLAIGRDMKLVIFLEQGVREPGGLFGDIEYIPFSRAHPHESFDKFLQVLKKLSPINAATAAEAKPADVKEKSQKPELSNVVSEPSPSWTMENYDEASFHKIIENDSEGLEKINTAFKASIFAQGDGLSEWEGRQEYYRALCGGAADLEKLKKLSAEHPTNRKLLFFVANAYEDYGDHLNAAKKFEEAASHSTDQFGALQNWGRAAVQYAHDGKMPRALELLEKIKTDGEGNPRLNEILVSVVGSLADIEKDEDLQLALLEKAVEEQPGDTAGRFNLAYKHSQTENGDMALHHYMKIPAITRDPTTWNNLGVCFGQIGMSVGAVRAFRKAGEENETLAMSNLGFKLLSAGFIDEAKAECDKAIKLDGYHKNVPLLATRLQEVPEEEKKKLDEALDKVKLKASFYRRLGDAVVLRAPKTVAGKWQSSEYVLEATLNGTAIRLAGSYQRPASPLANALGIGIGMPPHTVLQKIEYDGRVRGQIIISTVSRTGDNESASLLALGLDKGKALMYFNADGSELHIMENPQSISPNFYVLKRIS